MSTGLEVITPGLMTSVQDRGRFGFQALGISVSGALDPDGFDLANALAGNEAGTGALEIRMLGPTLEVTAESVTVALAGTGAGIEVMSPEREMISACRSVTFRKGQVFRIGAIGDSAVCYLAVHGGFDLPDVYGSQSTCMSAGFGGFHGRILEKGDCLPLRKAAAESVSQRILRRPPEPDSSPVIRVIAGPQDDYFSAAGIETFFGTGYTVSQAVNRMGMRLEGAAVAHEKGFNIASDGIVRGAIQVPGNGLPIILMADCQTTGGYPKIATVISTDMPKLGRMMPGADIRFEAVSVEEAEAVARDHHERKAALVDSIETFSGSVQQLEHLLMTQNLISGVTAG
ncbi:MAG: biotin-dependent carboxyltransferase family protein [Pseudomonadota bacterium]|nr:biotin-dependent carboxyltransferase family protein [Pseudomonadota bacterium]MEC7439109.1 biotin-dependent carboxyltransferase family protein [Pseudomonadota bacterium]MEC7485469.1 biotin-dependent carboxyltransferase family protein [Pseudomonadota bacterium]MEC7650306.1 biotin-dependent carboxyltransferase family protein [Pseudomonadota bacterium]MEC7853169.1 biotin-dependent carboxyltransferase family protein [Pseudomonadota bacterium]